MIRMTPFTDAGMLRFGAKKAAAPKDGAAKPNPPKPEPAPKRRTASAPEAKTTTPPAAEPRGRRSGPQTKPATGNSPKPKTAPRPADLRDIKALGLGDGEAELSPAEQNDLIDFLERMGKQGGGILSLGGGIGLKLSPKEDKEPKNPVEGVFKNRTDFRKVDTTGVTLKTSMAPQLATILSQTRVNNVLLAIPEPEIKDAVLKQLQDYVGPGKAVVKLDMKSLYPQIEPSISVKGNAVIARQALFSIQDLGEALGHAIGKTLGNDAQKPMILYIDNLNEFDTNNMVRGGEIHALRKNYPNVRIILPYIQPGKNEDSEEQDVQQMARMMTSMMGHGRTQQSSVKPWRQGDFEIVKMPALRPEEQASIILEDLSHTWVFEHFGMTFQPATLEKLIAMLQREYKAPLSLDDVRVELDSFGGYFSAKNSTPREVNDADLRGFLKEVVRKRNMQTTGASTNPMSGMISKCFETIPAGTIGITMDEVAGLEDVKNVIRTAFLQDDDKVLTARLRGQAVNEQKPTCILLSGPPGCGKTLLAKAVAGENKATFLNVSTARIVQGLVGSGPANVEMLEQAIENAPDDTVIVYMEEVDALGKRDDGRARFHQSADEERDKTINMMLEMLDGTKAFNKKVVFIGSTNRPGKLDKALKDRFQFKKTVGRPDAESRQEILQREIRLKNLSLSPAIDLKQAAEKTEGLSGRHLYTLIEQLDTAKQAKLLTPTRKQFASNEAYLKAVSDVEALKTRLKTDDDAVREFMTVSVDELDKYIAQAKATVAAKKAKRTIGFQTVHPS